MVQCGWWPGTESNRRQPYPVDSQQSNPAPPLEKPALSATKRNQRLASVCSPTVEAASERSPDSQTLVPPESSKLTIKPGEPFNAKSCLRLDGFPESGVCDTRLAMGARLTLTLIWNLLNRRQGCAWPTTAYLASKLGVTRQTVSGYITELVEAGYIKVEKRRRDGQRFASNVYLLLWRDEYHSLLHIGAEPKKLDGVCSLGPEKLRQLKPCQDSPCQREAVSVKPDIERKVT